MQKRVLLAHADPSVHELSRRSLSAMGIDVDVSADAEEAKTLLRDHRYGVVVADSAHTGLLHMLAELPPPRPIIIATTTGRGETLDPQLVSMVVPHPYDAHMLVGVMIACANEYLMLEERARPDGEVSEAAG